MPVRSPETKNSVLINALPGSTATAARAAAGETAAALHRAYLARQLGTEHDVLFEQTEKGYFTGHTMNYVKVYCDAENLRNEIRRVRITALFEDGVLAEPVSA